MRHVRPAARAPARPPSRAARCRAARRACARRGTRAPARRGAACGIVDVVVALGTATKVTVLSGGPFHEQLHLAVLVGRAERGERRRADRRAVRPDACQALRPELHEPGGEVAQRVGVRHSTWMCSPVLRVGEPLQHREDAGRILARARASRSASRHVARRRRAAPSMSMPISAAGSMPDRREHAEAAADVRRECRARGSPRAAAMRPQRALLRIGDEDEVLARRRRRRRSSRSRTMRYCAIVSAVPPDFDVTMNSVRARSSRSSSAAIVARVDVVEHVQPRACRRARASSSRFQHGGRSAVRSAMGPSAEPPMPSTTTSSNLPASRVGEVVASASRSAGVVGQVEEAELAALRGAARTPRAPRRTLAPRARQRRVAECRRRRRAPSMFV